MISGSGVQQNKEIQMPFIEGVQFVLGYECEYDKFICKKDV